MCAAVCTVSASSRWPAQDGAILQAKIPLPRAACDGVQCWRAWTSCTRWRAKAAPQGRPRRRSPSRRAANSAAPPRLERISGKLQSVNRRCSQGLWHRRISCSRALHVPMSCKQANATMLCQMHPGHMMKASCCADRGQGHKRQTIVFEHLTDFCVAQRPSDALQA